tara:strand:+ start:3878 stop:4684 length:807 start_codon:yes stop_codon:yes gene_type:complete
MIPKLPVEISIILGEEMSSIIHKYAYPKHPCEELLSALESLIPLQYPFLSHIIHFQQVSFIYKGDIVTMKKYMLGWEDYEDEQNISDVIEEFSEFNEKENTSTRELTNKCGVNYNNIISDNSDNINNLLNIYFNVSDFEKDIYYESLVDRRIMNENNYFDNIVRVDDLKTTSFIINKKYINFKICNNIPSQSPQEEFVMSFLKSKYTIQEIVENDDCDEEAYVHHKLFNNIEPQSDREFRIMNSIFHHIHEVDDIGAEFNWDYVNSLF